MVANYRTLKEIVFDALREAILHGKYQPGQHLVADDLARELGVSRMPVREALHRLEVTGLVSITPHRGAVINELSESEIIEIYHIRAVLEGLAARLAVVNLLPADHQQLTMILVEMAQMAHAGKVDAMLNLNQAFHRVIWTAARAPRLQALLENLYDASQRFRNISLLLPGRLEQITEEHQRIADALRAGDHVNAERYSNEHYETTAQRLLKSIEQKNKPESDLA